MKAQPTPSTNINMASAEAAQQRKRSYFGKLVGDFVRVSCGSRDKVGVIDHLAVANGNKFAGIHIKDYHYKFCRVDETTSVEAVAQYEQV